MIAFDTEGQMYKKYFYKSLLFSRKCMYCMNIIHLNVFCQLSVSNTKAILLHVLVYIITYIYIYIHTKTMLCYVRVVLLQAIVFFRVSEVRIEVCEI